MRRAILLLLVALPAWTGPLPPQSGPEDESVYAKALLPGQHESLLYVWTSDADAKDRNLDGKVPFRVWLLNVGPQGMQLDDTFVVDFDRFPTGPARPHDMLLK